MVVVELLRHRVASQDQHIRSNVHARGRGPTVGLDALDDHVANHIDDREAALNGRRDVCRVPDRDLAASRFVAVLVHVATDVVDVDAVERFVVDFRVARHVSHLLEIDRPPLVPGVVGVVVRVIAAPGHGWDAARSNCARVLLYHMLLHFCFVSI